jgi:hypothetical protein
MFGPTHHQQTRASLLFRLFVNSHFLILTPMTHILRPCYEQMFHSLTLFLKVLCLSKIWINVCFRALEYRHVEVLM